MSRLQIFLFQVKNSLAPRKMTKNIFWCLLIFSTFLSQGSGTLTGLSSLLVRKKRIIDNSPNANPIVPIRDVPYIVNILEDGRPCCSGSILAPDIIITAAHCVEDPAFYSVLSGSQSSNRGTEHNIIRIIMHPEYKKEAYSNDIVLLTIFPHIVFYPGSVNEKIDLYSEIPVANTLVTVSGWGCTQEIEGNLKYSTLLRSINVKILDQGKCQRTYRLHTNITDKEICTWDRRGQKRCGLGDSGGPLAITRKLAGVMAFMGNLNAPDVFINVAHPEYREWILSHLSNNHTNPHELHNPYHLQNSHNLYNPHNFRNPHNRYIHNPHNQHNLHL